MLFRSRTGTLPFTPTHLSLAGDYGGTQTHWSIAAHGPQGELAIIDYGTVLAPEDLIELLKSKRYTGSDGRTHEIAVGLLDSGAHAHRIYRVCMRSGGRLFPSKGSKAEFARNLWNQSTVTEHPDVHLITFVTHSYKLTLYLDKIANRRAPLLTFPVDASAAFLNGHCGQRLRSEKTARGVRHFFPDVPHDHFGDCTILHLVIASMLSAGGKT